MDETVSLKKTHGGDEGSKRGQARRVAGGFLTHLRSNVNVAWELCLRQRASLMGPADSFVSKGVGTVTFGKGDGEEQR